MSALPLRSPSHTGTLDAYTFTLVLPYDSSASRVTFSNTLLTSYSWTVNWPSFIPPALNTGCKWRVTHDFVSEIFTLNPNTLGWGAAYIGIQGLPGVQVYNPAQVTPAGFACINYVLPQVSSSNPNTTVAPNGFLLTNACNGYLLSTPSSFICGNPAVCGTSSIKLIIVPLPMNNPNAQGSPTVTGVHRLKFELIADA